MRRAASVRAAFCSSKGRNAAARWMNSSSGYTFVFLRPETLLPYRTLSKILLSCSLRVERELRKMEKAGVFRRSGQYMYFILIYEVLDDFVNRRAPFRTEHLKLVEEAHRR